MSKKYCTSSSSFLLRLTIFGILLSFTSIVVSAPKPLNQVRVNQHGYLPDQPKYAVYVGSAGATWHLVNSAGTTVATGTTTTYGFDNASGDNVSHIDFSDYKTKGDNYTIRVGADSSYPFKISDYVYSFMKEDAMMYFYHQRFSQPVEAKYVGVEFARAAGHFDIDLECDDDLPSDWPADTHCSYSLDVRGGHQDAGDYGGYVVNGGYYTWLLQYMYEANDNVFPDGSLRIPENNNGLPDILDEARIELDFIMRMQVPQNKSPYPGMIHHKKSAQAWAPFPLAPADDDGIYWGNPQVKRTIKPVSTAATLNGAAVMAQAARLWQNFPSAVGFDGSAQPYHQTLIEKAELAWNAALAAPNLFASTDASKGSGPYNDSKVEDEFYWAAVELYLTTGKPEYKDFVTNSPLFAQYRPFDWQEVQVAGNLSLLLNKNTNGLTAEQNTALANNLASYTDGFVTTIDSEGYMTPLAPINQSPTGGTCNGNYVYQWGSTGSFVLSSAIQLSAIHRETNDDKYLDAITRTMDHVMGINALDRVYMTGYGENPTTEPHHRFWLKSKGNPVTEVAAAVSVPYPAAMAGGPQNDFVEDGTSGPETEGTPCETPAKSYADHWNNYSSNEITVNWNANLAAVVAYIDEVIPAPLDATAPDKPSGIVAQATSGSSINISWPSTPDNGQVRQYIVQMKPNGGVYDIYATTRFNSWSFVPLAPSTEYCFKLQAEDFNGAISIASDEICETTLPSTAYEIYYQPDNSAMSDYVGTGAINQPESPKSVLGNGWYHYEFHQNPPYDFHFSMPNYGSPERFSPDGTGSNWRVQQSAFSAEGTLWLTSDKQFHSAAPIIQPLDLEATDGTDNGGGNDGGNNGGNDGNGNTGDNTPPEGYTLAGDEGETINITGIMNVAYGVNGIFNFLFDQNSDLQCDNATFGDPVPGVAKFCFTQPVEQDNGGGDGDGDGDNTDNMSCSNTVTVARKAKVEVDLNVTDCVLFEGFSAGKTVQVWDSDANSSCDFRGTVTSEDGSGTFDVNSNYAASNALSGPIFKFTPSNSCEFLQVRWYQVTYSL